MSGPTCTDSEANSWRSQTERLAKRDLTLLLESLCPPLLIKRIARNLEARYRLSGWSRVPQFFPLYVSDAAFNFPFSIWILGPARQGETAIVSQHVAIEGIQSGIVDVGDKYAFLQIIEHHDAGTAAESAEGFLVQLSPMRELEPKQSKRTALRLHPSVSTKQSCASVFAGLSFPQSSPLTNEPIVLKDPARLAFLSL